MNGQLIFSTLQPQGSDRRLHHHRLRPPGQSHHEPCLVALRGLCARLEEGLSQVAPLAHHCCRVVQLCSEGHDSAGVAHLGCDNGLSRRRLRAQKGFEHERLNQHNHDELSTNISPKIVCVCVNPQWTKTKLCNYTCFLKWTVQACYASQGQCYPSCSDWYSQFPLSSCRSPKWSHCCKQSSFSWGDICIYIFLP